MAVLRLERTKMLPPDQEIYLTLFSSLRQGETWATANDIVATGQFSLTPHQSITSLFLGTDSPTEPTLLSPWDPNWAVY